MALSLLMTIIQLFTNFTLPILKFTRIKFISLALKVRLKDALDIKSAYDSVHNDDLIYKNLQLGIIGKITKLIHNFLQKRSFQIDCRNTMSDKKNSYKGLTQ